MDSRDRKRREFILRWLPARKLYMQGCSSQQITDVMDGINSVKAMERRIVRFRKQFGWFMFRNEPVVTSNLGL